MTAPNVSTCSSAALSSIANGSSSMYVTVAGCCVAASSIPIPLARFEGFQLPEAERRRTSARRLRDARVPYVLCELRLQRLLGWAVSLTVLNQRDVTYNEKVCPRRDASNKSGARRLTPITRSPCFNIASIDIVSGYLGARMAKASGLKQAAPR
jgi:hypothetical protein